MRIHPDLLFETFLQKKQLRSPRNLPPNPPILGPSRSPSRWISAMIQLCKSRSRMRPHLPTLQKTTSILGKSRSETTNKEMPSYQPRNNIWDDMMTFDRFISFSTWSSTDRFWSPRFQRLPGTVPKHCASHTRS